LFSRREGGRKGGTKRVQEVSSLSVGIIQRGPEGGREGGRGASVPDQLPLQHVDGLGFALLLHPQLRGGLVDKVNGLVGHETVLGREGGREGGREEGRQNEE